MKKSFAENCIRYISTATALILALAMLCCANFSASAKNLGSNLTITDTTLLLEDINTTTNTTPAKTKDLIASGANVDVVSTGISGTYYLDLSDNYSNWEQSNARFAVCTYTNGSNHTWYDMQQVSGEDHIYQATINDSNVNINFVRMNPGTTENNWTNKWNETGDLTPETGKNCYKVKSGSWDKGGGTWSTYSSATTYTVTFHANGHRTRPDAQTVTSGGKATVPTPPTAEGWTFVGWYTESSCTNAYDFDTPVTADLHLYAKWTENASSDVSADIISVLKGEKIMFYVGEYTNWNQNTVYLNTTASSTGSTSVSLTLSGSTSPGPGSDKYNFVTLPAAKYYVTHKSDFSYKPVMTSTAVAGNYYLVQDTNPKVYSSSGAKSTTVNEEALTITTSSTAGKSGVGKSYSTVYYIKSDTAYSSIGTTESAVNTYLANMADGTYTLYTCDTDGNITVLRDTDTFTKSSVVKYDVNVHYNSKGGTDYTSKIEENTEFTEPTSTSVTGYTLEGWYTTSTFDTGTKVTFPLTITGNTDLYAHWTANKYTVSFDSQGGNNTPANMEVTYDGTYGTLPSAGTKTGHTFTGWYTSATGGTKVTETTKVTITAPQTLYAQWTADTYTITLNKDGGTINSGDVTSYTYGEGATLPTDVTKEGYTFLGWKDDETESMVESISKTDTGNKSFTAQWKLNTFEHQYVFMEVSKKTWFYNDSSYGVVSFDGGTTYIDMQELFTNTSTYKSSAKKSNLLFAKVPEGTTTIIFSRKNTTDGVVSINKTTYKYSNYTTNNLLTLASGDNTLNGTWSTVDYTPVPVSVTHGTNGTVVASKTLADTTTTITVKKGETKYFDSTTTGISVAVTPETDYRIKSFTVNGEEKKSVFESLETGGTYNLDALTEASYDIQATFEEVPKDNPTVTISDIPNSTISFTYTDPAGTVQTATAPGDYVVQYKSDISLVISPNPGYHLVSITGLTTESTLPIAGNVTATKAQVKADLTVSYELAKNPTVTIEVPANCTVDFTYTNDNGVSTTATTAGTYSVYYGSNVSYKVTPNDGFYVASMTGVTTKTPKPPVTEAVTGSISNITTDVADTITCTLNPNPTVTIECYDSTGTKIESGAGITVDGGTGALTKQSKSVLYNSETRVTFTASADAEDVHHYRFLGYYTTTTPVDSPIESGGIDDYDVTVDGNSINIYRVTSDITLYAIFSQQYKVTFNYENLTNFTVDGTAVATGGSVYVSAGANLSLVATLSDDYKLTNDCWSIDSADIGTFTPNGLSATYISGSGDVTITLKPEIATYTGEGKWGSKTLKIDTSDVKKDTPWFAVSFKKSSTDTNDYFIRCSKVSDDLYECVIPDGYTYFDVYRMAKGAKEFTTNVETKDGKLDSTIAWNKTNSTTEIASNTSYKLSFNGTVGQMSIATN